jgi:N-glycosylase/DNA lyase
VHLPVDGPLDLAATLDGGQAFRWRRDGEWWHGVIGGNVVRLRQIPGGLALESAPEAPGHLAPLLRRYFRLDDDFMEVQRLISQDARVAAAVSQHPGLRLLRQDPWECLAAFILSANSNILRISKTVEALAERYGQRVRLGRLIRHIFPSPKVVARAGEAGLRALGLGFRAPYLAATAEAVASGRIALERLREVPYEEARVALMALPGVGEKVADCVLLFSLDKLEAFPVDRWVRRALRDWYPECRHLPDRRLGQWARQHFGPLAGYAQQYLFHRRRLVGRRSSQQPTA